MMDYILIILGFSCLIIGIIGSVVPALPGPPIAWLGLLLAHFSPWVEFSPAMLIITAVLAVVITVLDYVIPSMATKHYGGGRYGIWGCNIGLIISMFGLPFGPTGLLGVIFWPFVGAFVGEYIKQQDFKPALRAAWGAFVGFLCGTAIKLVYCITVLIIAIANLF